MPCVSASVLHELDMIGDPEYEADDDMFATFFNNFGTHFIKEVKMGAKFIAKTTFKSSTQEIMKSKGKTVGFNAEVSAFGFSVGGGTSTSKDTTNT